MIDCQVQVKVVTANGQYLVANECSNTDLFFALRGGGGSAFGVVMESSHRLEPQLTLQVYAHLLLTPEAVLIIYQRFAKLYGTFKPKHSGNMVRDTSE